VIPTNEELVIVEDTASILKKEAEKIKAMN